MAREGWGLIGPSKHGRWIGRDIVAAGKDLVAVLSTTQESANKAKEYFEGQGITGPGTTYHSSEREFFRENGQALEGVFIVTPPITHHRLGMRAMDYEIPIVAIEKPITAANRASREDSIDKLADLINKAEKRDIVLATQLQLPYLVDQMKEFSGADLSATKTFRFDGLFPGTATPEELINDFASHIGSVIHSVYGNINFVQVTGKQFLDSGVNLELKATTFLEQDISNIGIGVRLRKREDVSAQERYTRFVFGNHEFTVKQTETEKFGQVIVYRGEQTPVDNPLAKSVKDIVEGNPRFGPEESMEIIEFQESLETGSNFMGDGTFLYDY